MTFAKEDLISALRMRYDFYSAESVFDLARERANVAEKASFDPADVRAIRAVLPSVGDRLTPVLARFDELLEAAPAAKGEAAKPAKQEEPKVEAKKEEPKAEAKKEEPKAEAKKDEAKPAETIETTIVLSGVKAGDGDQVLVCGNGELGGWDPEKARQMKRTGDEWLTTVKVAPDAELSFKFLRRTEDGKVIWEDGENRTMSAKPRLEVTWR